MKNLFPITIQWSWWTFILYLISSYSVCVLCKMGAKKNTNKIVRFKNRCLKINFNVYYCIAILILTLLATIRTYEVGPDTESYVMEFLTANKIEFNWSRLLNFHQLEPGYQLLIMVIRSFTDNYHIYFFIIFIPLAYAYVAFIKYFYKKEDVYLFLPIFIFYFVNNMSGIRSAIGTIFLLCSFIQLDKKNYNKAFLLTLIASCFHYTMLYNLYIIFMSRIFKSFKMKKKRWLWILGIVLGIVFTNLGLNILITSLQNTKYGFYSRDIGDRSLLGSIIFVIFGIVSLLIYKTIIEKKDSRISLLIMGMSFLVTYPVLFITGAYRIAFYYIMPRLVIWDLFIKKILLNFDKKSQLICKLVIYLVVFLFLLLRFTKSSLDGNFVYFI